MNDREELNVLLEKHKEELKALYKKHTCEIQSLIQNTPKTIEYKEEQTDKETEIKRLEEILEEEITIRNNHGVISYRQFCEIYSKRLCIDGNPPDDEIMGIDQLDEFLISLDEKIFSSLDSILQIGWSFSGEVFYVDYIEIDITELDEFEQCAIMTRVLEEKNIRYKKINDNGEEMVIYCE